MDSQAAQFRLALIVVSPLNALDQIDTKKHFYLFIYLLQFDGIHTNKKTKQNKTKIGKP